jgi:hypothetical protein
MTNNTVTAPLVIVRDENGLDQYLYRGAIVPDYVKGDALQLLLDANMVEAGTTNALAADQGDGGPPPRSANKPQWEEYAVSRGMSAEDASAATKDDLIDRFGG